MQYINIGNQFQRDMGIKFNSDLLSASALTPSVREKEDLVYEYIKNMNSYIQQPMGFSANGNPSGLYADYSDFKNRFVKYWRRTLHIAMTDKQQLEDIFDEAIISQEQSKNCNITAIYFENGNALTVGDCLNAVYDAIEIV